MHGAAGQPLFSFTHAFNSLLLACLTSASLPSPSPLNQEAHSNMMGPHAGLLVPNKSASVFLDLAGKV